MTITIDDYSELDDVVEDIRQQLLNMDFSDEMEHVHQMLVEDHEKYFDMEMSPQGNPWAPLSPVTVAAKGHGTILVDTDEMRRSLVEDSHENHIKEIQPDELFYGTRDKKSRKHQDGGGNLPARPHVGWNEPLVDKVADYVADQTVKKLQEDES